MAEVQVWGIRHHGAGSARSIQTAIASWQPDIILIEGAEDTNALLSYVANEALQPPVALLVYNPKDLKQAAYYPFTEFSPEWQAMQEGAQRNIPVRQIDLPQSMKFALHDANQKEEASLHEEGVVRDPLAYIGEAAGYTDGERWWEVTFEQRQDSTEVFDAILELMTALREELALPETQMTLCREAYMRKQIRKAVREKYERIAVICGAWHAPVLQNYKAFTVKADNACLKGIKKVKTASTWIPWTYTRIAQSSGYGAGIVSPAWYQFLFHHQTKAVQRWMIEVARLLRKEGIEASAAHAIEAVRLAHALASLRGLSLPGIAEMHEAVVTVFGGGHEARVAVIMDKLIIGDRLGAVPDEVPIIPLQKDLEQTAKKLRLKKSIEPALLKATKANPKGGLDLRKTHDQAQSAFLHQLRLLNIPWGTPEKASGRELSTKNEYWSLCWKPEFALAIIEAGMWGNTVSQAATHKVLDTASSLQALPALSTLLDDVLKAKLEKASSYLVERAQHLAAQTKDIGHLLSALLPLARIVRYGDVRGTAQHEIHQVFVELVPRITAALPSACVQLNEEASRQRFAQLLEAQQAFALIQDAALMTQWLNSLERVANLAQGGGLLAGLATRILFDQGLLNVEYLETQMQFALSEGQAADESAYWLEGFLHGSGLLLVHHPELWTVLNTWVQNLPEEGFTHLLPMLRRTFSNFHQAEREKMLRLARGEQLYKPNWQTGQKHWNKTRGDEMTQHIATLLGWAQ